MVGEGVLRALPPEAEVAQGGVLAHGVLQGVAPRRPDLIVCLQIFNQIKKLNIKTHRFRDFLVGRLSNLWGENICDLLFVHILYFYCMP